MVTAENVMTYGELGVDEWEATSDQRASRRAAFSYLRGDPFIFAETGSEVSYAVERLYRARRRRPRSTNKAFNQRDVAYVVFATIPTVAFSISALGVIATILAFAEKEPAYLIPGVLAALGFAVLGSVAYYILRLMRKAYILRLMRKAWR